MPDVRTERPDLNLPAQAGVPLCVGTVMSTRPRDPRTSCVYPGSFDPFTYGHLAVVMCARRIFEEVHVVVAVNPNKLGCFTVEERVALIADEVRGIEGVTVGSTASYVVAYARQHGYGSLVRGLRGDSDVRDEMVLAGINGALAPDVQTVLLPTSPALSACSSSRVRALHEAGEPVGLYVAPGVVRALDAKRASRA
jgi:pantetheine-phosphate adenylyltransferase